MIVTASGKLDKEKWCWCDGEPTEDGEGTSCTLLVEHKGSHAWVADDQIDIRGLGPIVDEEDEEEEGG